MEGRYPKISAIVPVYNVESYLERCLRSIAAQTYPNWEAVLVDDASTDGGGEICRAWAARDGRFRYAAFPVNQGLSAARNAGVERAEGELAVFIDSDDHVEPELLEALYRSRQETGAEICVCGDEGMGLEAGPAAVYSAGEAALCLARRAPFLWTAWGKLYPMELVRAVPFRREAVCCEDLVFFYELLKRVERVSYIPGRLYHYTRRPGSLVNSGVDQRRCAVLPVLEEICADAPGWFPPQTADCFRLIALDAAARLAMQAVEGGADGPLWGYLRRFRDHVRRQFRREALELCRDRKTRAAVLALRASAAVFWGAAALYGRVKRLRPGTK
ncbi:MAG: glycosyltransferase family 2 protein [Oscillospiraceae bacterium]|nr:glycosyltransferase family 2 protein [Oscillospiraceae bacterium]